MNPEVDYDWVTNHILTQKFVNGDWYVHPLTGDLLDKENHLITGSEIHGYLYTKAHWNGITANISIARAVWVGSHGGRAVRPGYQIDHMNGIKTDNRPCNLREVLASENCSNPNTKRQGARHPKAKLTEEQVDEILRIYFDGTASCRQIGDSYNISSQQVSRICRGKAYKKQYQVFMALRNKHD